MRAYERANPILAARYFTVTEAAFWGVVLMLVAGVFFLVLSFPRWDQWGRVPDAECGRWHRMVTPGEVTDGWQIQERGDGGWIAVETYDGKSEAVAHCVRLRSS